MNISLKQLKVFVAITQHTTLTAASESLFLSKAAVSMALSELEKQLGHPLFDRINNRLMLNQEGQKLLPLADELISRVSTIDSLFLDNAPVTGTLRIGASDTIGNHLLPCLLSDFRKKQEHFSQKILISNSEYIHKKLLDYELDIALVEGKAYENDLVSRVFNHDSMCIISPKNHHLINKSKVNFEDLNNSHWVLREEGSGSRTFFLNKIAPNIEHWKKSVELNTTEALINCVANGFGLGCLSSLSAQYAIRDGRISRIELNYPMRRDFWMVMHKDKYKNPLLKKFIEFCEQY
ncbi:LysR family transcriptional regulator [Salinivibrio sp. YCSC6]|uniref:LysR family transcriptional regulator n=2 Tax=Vibrionaceae TaxID=641 RepID=A0ABX6K4K7_SALCS|nr:LysR family transcriptional regulator [Salinivibrio sp. YCSC6]QCF35623.1 LysR family transcriptional regulator [Salinivibrio sp. YCSC6]QIR06394.1 LysR family transcriptional regulator [Salinivibrio costicola]